MKGNLRKQELLKRDLLSATQIFSKSRQIMQKLFSLKEFNDSNTIAFYVSVKSEVHTHEMIEKSIALGKKVSVPILRQKENKLEFSEISSLKDLHKTPFGLLEPKKELEKIAPLDEIDLVIVPGIAFDRQGNRIGYGKGYYDRLLKQLSSLAVTIGLCFEENLLESIPATKNDEKVNIVLTEKKSISFLE